MAAAASGKAGPGGGTMANGVVYSKGLELFVARSQMAIAAARPLLASLTNLTTASDALSKASAGAIQLPTERLKSAERGLTGVTDKTGSALTAFGRFVGVASAGAAKLVGLVAVIGLLTRAKALLTGGSLKSANALSLGATALGVFGGKISPVVGASTAFVNVMKMLPGRLGAVGSSALAGGIGLGLLSGGIGPLSAGLSLLSVGFKGIPGQLGKIVTAIGAATTVFGLASAALTVLTTVVTAFGVALVTLGPGLLFGVKLAAQAEQSQIAFEVMTGSAQTAKKLLGEIRAHADATPWGSAELIDASRSLLAFGEAADNIVPALSRIGDISSGIGAPIGEIAQLYGKARVQGRLFAVDINQLTNRGIPIIQELAKQFRVTDSEVKALVESGSVQFEHLERAFVSLTSEGGRFHNMTARQSKSLIGLWSTFKDQVGSALRDVGEQMVATGSLQRLMATGGKLVQTVTPLMIAFAEVVAATATAGAWLSESLAGLFGWIGRLTGGVREWSTVLKIVVPALLAVAAAVLVVTAAEKALAIAKIAVLALSGPKGWALLAVGLIAAGAATASLASSMQKAGAASEDAAQKAQDVAEAAKSVQPIQVVAPGEVERLKLMQDMLEKYRSSADSLKLEWAEIDKAFTSLADREKFGLLALNNATGIFNQIRSVTREIDILEGRATKAQHAMQDMLAAGAPPRFAAQLKSQMELLDRLQEKQKTNEKRKEIEAEAGKKQEREAEQSKDNADDWAERLKTPLQKFKDEIAAINANQDMSLDQKGLAMDLLGRDFLKAEQARNPQATTPPKNEALVSGTQAALSAVIAATTARRPQQRTEDLLDQLNKTASLTKDGIDILARNAVTHAVLAQSQPEAQL